MVSWWIGGLLGVVALVTVAWPRWTHVFTAGRYRGPGRRSVGHRLWPVRMVGAIVLAAVIAFAVGEIWPGDGDAREVAGTFTLAILFVALTIWFLAVIVSRYDRESHAIAAQEAETGYRGIWGGTTPGYGPEIVAVVVTAAVALMAAFGVVGMRDRIGIPDVEATASPTPTPTVNSADEALKAFNDLHAPLTVQEAVPDGHTLFDPWWYAVVDVGDELPYAAWHRATPLRGGVPADYLSDADIVLITPRIGCAITGVVVVETDTTVSVALTYSGEHSTAAEPGTCNALVGVFREWFPVDLAAPLGDRTVQTLEGNRIGEPRP